MRTSSPQAAGMPIVIVVPFLLQMGWVESPPHFCTATETARDIASDYSNTPIGSITPHKFANYVRGDNNFKVLLTTSEDNNSC